MAAYTGSLDMPELEGALSLDDIMEGHRAAGRFMADR
jgi:mycothiol synthase